MTDGVRAAVLASLVAVAPEADPDALDDDEELREQLDLDSLDFVAFVSGMADRTGVAVPERDYPQLQTITACVAYVQARRATSG